MSSLLIKDRFFADGQWRVAADGRSFSVDDPATGENIAHVPDCSAAEAAQAVEEAHRAFPGWAATPAAVRADRLRQWFNLILAHRDELARIMTRESGKPLAESLGEVQYGASFVEWFAEEAKRVYGDIIPAPGSDRRLFAIKQPVGVCAAITPWNFPLAMITRKCAPALAAGCTVVVKPAEATPLTALALASLAEEAGIPAGVFNVVTASRGEEIGKVLTTHPLVRKVSFTGSTRVGKHLLRQCADTVKRVSMELGGNAPFIVFDDADLDRAVEGAIASKYRNTGQTCVCANRLLVQEGVHDEFISRLCKRVDGFNIGHGLEPGVDQGPLISEAALHKVDELVRDALAHGATALSGGKPRAGGRPFYEPTVLANVDPKMRIANEEIFGPVAPVIRFANEDEAVALANDTPYGLAAYFYSSDPARIWRVGEALEYGMVGINEGVISTATAPFGGVKESGLGREGSRYGIEEYLELKYLCLGGLA